MSTVDGAVFFSHICDVPLAGTPHNFYLLFFLLHPIVPYTPQ
jgi:hypothetical protein